MTRSWPSVVIATAALLALLAVTPVAKGAFPGRNGRIAYVHTSYSSPEDGSEPPRSEVSLMSGALRGGEHFTLRSCTRIADVPQDSDCATTFGSPAYSPDGQRLVVDAGSGLAILSSDGSDFFLLPPQTADDGEPAWSPDGGRIVFAGTAPGATVADLYVLNVARGTSRRLTTTGGRSPAWSSRNRIAYVKGYSHVIGQRERGQLATIKPDGSGFRRLTRKGGLAPDWSPHGTKIVFVRKGYLYVVGANGKHLRRVRGRQPISAEEVVWSPNGRLLAYHSFESGIFIVRADGSHEQEFADGAYGVDASYDSFAPDWQALPHRR